MLRFNYETQYLVLTYFAKIQDISNKILLIVRYYLYQFYQTAIHFLLFMKLS